MREQGEIEGHAVRALYLAAGVTDLYLETGEEALLDAMRAQWRDMAGRKTYVTGGLGAHHMDEAFGDAYELPPDRCYGETCAAIASVQWNQRMLLVTGEARYADLLERTLYNGVLAGLALDGGGYSYVNPLHVRDDHRDPVERGARRQPWYACACCPPNVMRLLASLQHYLATTRRRRRAAAPVRERDARPVCRCGPTTRGTAASRSRSPRRARSRGRSACASRRGAASTRLDGEPVAPGGYARLARQLACGRDGDARARHDAAARRSPHPRIDAVRGCAAIERGPLVYCFEGADAPAGARVDDLRLDPGGALRAVERPDLLGGIVAIEAGGEHRPAADGEWPYGAAGDGTGAPVSLLAVPYSHWGNRGDGGMRVWTPVVSPLREPQTSASGPS